MNTIKKNVLLMFSLICLTSKHILNAKLKSWTPPKNQLLVEVCLHVHFDVYKVPTS